MGIPLKTQRAVAKRFWDYMRNENARPKTRSEMRELYSIHFRPYLTDPTEKRVLLGQILYNLKGLKLIEKQPPHDKETIVYRQMPVVAVDHDFLRYVQAGHLGQALRETSEQQELEEDTDVSEMVKKLKKDLVSKRLVCFL